MTNSLVALIGAAICEKAMISNPTQTPLNLNLKSRKRNVAVVTVHIKRKIDTGVPLPSPLDAYSRQNKQASSNLQHCEENDS